MPVLFLAIASAIASPSSVEPSTAITDWNRTVLEALQQHARERNADSVGAANQLMQVARQVAADKRLREADRRRLLGQIQRRLNVTGQRVLAQQIGPQAGAGGAQAGGEALKELIEKTIEPESWDVNGGRGHIHVFRE